MFHISDSKVAKPRTCVFQLSIMILTYTSSVREKRKKKKRTCSTATLLEISYGTVMNFQGINSKTTRVNSNKPNEILITQTLENLCYEFTNTLNE